MQRRLPRSLEPESQWSRGSTGTLAVMKYKRFEDLPVHQTAIDLGAHVFIMADDRSFRGRGDLADQLQRAVASISNNIAEGFERGTTQEMITHIYYARGSAGEVRSMLILLERLPFFDHLKSEISNLKSLCESVSRQLRAWADSMQNTEIRGTRYLTDGVRAQTEQRERARKFLDRIEELRTGKTTDALP